MILYSNINDITETTTEENTEGESNASNSEMEVATSGDAYLIISQQELNRAVETLPKLYDLFSFWFLMWLCFSIFGRIRKQIQNHTKEMGDKR